jgi:hypothetical protein
MTESPDTTPAAGQVDSTDRAPVGGSDRPAEAATRKPRRDRRVKTAITLTGADGLRRRHYFYGRTKREARQKAENARQWVATGAPVRDATCTLNDWLAEWRQTFLRASDRAESTKSLYAGLTLNHIEPVVCHLRLHQIRPVDVTRVLLSMEADSKSASTRRSAYAALRPCLAQPRTNDTNGWDGQWWAPGSPGPSGTRSSPTSPTTSCRRSWWSWPTGSSTEQDNRGAQVRALRPRPRMRRWERAAHGIPTGTA